MYNVINQVSDTAHVSVFYQSEVQYHSSTVQDLGALSRQAITPSCPIQYSNKTYNLSQQLRTSQQLRY